MFPTSPPAVVLSRPRLKALTKWVRDELDLLVAREGPDVLRPDDVLVLHETFIALRLTTDITALDLRATGIHRAVQDIAGVATRWPGRLCDDCDKIISIWTAKFGPLDALRPFLYGRGGRLEGIASVTEYSREVTPSGPNSRTVLMGDAARLCSSDGTSVVLKRYTPNDLTGMEI
jgi:hypothetical protein